MEDNVELGREIIARLAEADHEFEFAREVRAGGQQTPPCVGYRSR